MRSPFRSKWIQTQGFGENPSYYAQFGLKGHEGGDYIPQGTDWTVYSLTDGVVVTDEDNKRSGAYGVYVTIWDPSRKIALQYCHLEENYVSNGDRVTKGQRIGKMGSTGNSTGPHLHLNRFEVDDQGYRLNRNNGYLGGTDPLPFLSEDEPAPQPEVPTNAYSHDLFVLFHATDPNQIKVNLGGEFGWMERQAIMGSLHDLNRDYKGALAQASDLKRQLDEATRALEECREKAKTPVSPAPLPQPDEIPIDPAVRNFLRMLVELVQKFLAWRSVQK